MNTPFSNGGKEQEVSKPVQVPAQPSNPPAGEADGVAQEPLLAGAARRGQGAAWPGVRPRAGRLRHRIAVCASRARGGAAPRGDSAIAADPRRLVEGRGPPGEGHMLGPRMRREGRPALPLWQPPDVSAMDRSPRLCSRADLYRTFSPTEVAFWSFDDGEGREEGGEGKGKGRAGVAARLVGGGAAASAASVPPLACTAPCSH
jgi:hypothetical protein